MAKLQLGKVRILGVDPGLTHTGWGLINKDRKGNIELLGSGVISASTKLSVPERLCKLGNEFEKVLEEYEMEEAAIEEIFINKNPKSSITLCYARGVILMKLALHKISIAEYSANHIKKSIVGYGHADKNQITAMIKIILPAAIISRHDVADAISAAVCHAYSFKI